MAGPDGIRGKAPDAGRSSLIYTRYNDNGGWLFPGGNKNGRAYTLDRPWQVKSVCVGRKELASKGTKQNKLEKETERRRRIKIKIKNRATMKVGEKGRQWSSS